MLHGYREQMVLATWEHGVGPCPTGDLGGLFQPSWFYDNDSRSLNIPTEPIPLPQSHSIDTTSPSPHGQGHREVQGALGEAAGERCGLDQPEAQPGTTGIGGKGTGLSKA